MQKVRVRIRKSCTEVISDFQKFWYNHAVFRWRAAHDPTSRRTRAGIRRNSVTR